MWLALAVIIGFIALHSPPARELVRRVVVWWSSSAIEGVVAIESLRYRLWRGEFELSGFQLTPGSVNAPAEISAERIEIHFTPTLQVSIAARGLDVTLIDVFKGPSGGASFPLPLRIRSAHTEGARLRFMDREVSGKLEERFSFTGVSVAATTTGDELEVALGAGEARARGIPFGPLEAQLSLSPSETVRVLSVAIENGESYEAGLGRIRNLLVEAEVEGGRARLQGELPLAPNPEHKRECSFLSKTSISQRFSCRRERL